MSALHQLATLATFLLMLFSPCISAAHVMLTWDRLDEAYFRLEASVTQMLESSGKLVPGNLHIRPMQYPKSLIFWTAAVEVAPALEAPAPVPVEEPTVTPTALPIAA